MAINTDAAFGKSALGEREVSHPTDFQDTEKLLSAVTTEPTGESNLKPCDTSLNLRSSIHSLNAELDGHQSPLRSGTATMSPSQLSFGPPLLLRSPVPPGSEPPSYLWLAVLSCFCLAVPVNMFALWYAHMSQSVLQTGDVEGAKRLGRLSLLLSCIAMFLGVAVIIFIVVTGDILRLK
ncbi:trafficking regulator of GLUT4 1 [Salmo salar]|uniref:Trafficking regulator of GLUT4 1 n=1 Tax=Salmo salar TaxID=8030 RepID=A0A1S3RGB6_SALSA|nr:trafficking regulator of GLUT4 1-like [Salmo salar]|eukprot:XP_014051261.1 PREDICTED: tumor suppressor candidate 5 homolog [Salmo salar]